MPRNLQISFLAVTVGPSDNSQIWGSKTLKSGDMPFFSEGWDQLRLSPELGRMAFFRDYVTFV